MLPLTAGWLLLSLSSGDARAESTESAQLYESALSYIDELYLYRDELELDDLRQGLAEQIEREFPWAWTHIHGTTLVISWGSEEEIGRIPLRSWEGLAEAMLEIQALLESNSVHHSARDVQVLLLQGFTQALDRHSRILYGQKLEAFEKRIHGTLSGIGASLSAREHRIVVRKVYPGTPAERAGLLPGDILLRIDARSAIGLSLESAIERVTGPAGTPVHLMIERGGETLYLSPTREQISIPNVHAEVVAEGIGRLEIEHFSEKTLTHLREGLQHLAEQDAMRGGLILDLRGNTGGSMIQSAKVADEFLTQGALLTTEGRDGEKVRGLLSRIEAQAQESAANVPIVILQDSRTASGSEIVAGALRELGRAILIGSSSYGKGTVQKVFRLDEDTRLKLTVARYLLPGGLQIDSDGLKPDLEVGSIELDHLGMHRSQDVDPQEALMVVRRSPGWAGQGEQAALSQDPLLDLAVEILKNTSSGSREACLWGLEGIEGQLRQQQEESIEEALSQRGIDWSSGRELVDGTQLQATLSASQPLRAGETGTLRVSVSNSGEQAAHRVLIRLESDERLFNNLILPVGRVPAGGNSEGWVQLDVPPSYRGRAASMRLFLEADQQDGILLGEDQVVVEGQSAPQMSLSVQMAGVDGSGSGLGQALIYLHNLSPLRLENLRVNLSHPGEATVELYEAEADLGFLDPGYSGGGAFDLLWWGEEEDIPLTLSVSADGLSRILKWDLELPVDGTLLHLKAPLMTAQGLPATAPAGPLSFSLLVQDEGVLEDVVVWFNKDKVHYQYAGMSSLGIPLQLELREGKNTITLEARDEQGIQTRESWHVLGLTSSP